MPVIINDLEIIIEGTDTAPSQPDAAAPAASDDTAIKRSLTPRTLEQIDRFRRARAARIRGH